MVCCLLGEPIVREQHTAEDRVRNWQKAPINLQKASLFRNALVLVPELLHALGICPLGTPPSTELASSWGNLPVYTSEQTWLLAGALR
jgi:hypothetical protein